MCGAVLARFYARMATDHDPGTLGITEVEVADLLADAVQPGCNVLQAGDERGVRGGYADVVPIGAQPGHERAHGVFADATDGDETGHRVGDRVKKPRRKPFGQFGHAGGIQKVGGGSEQSTGRLPVQRPQRLAQHPTQRRLLAGLAATVDPGERDAAKLYGLAQADAMAAAGRNLESMSLT